VPVPTLAPPAPGVRPTPTWKRVLVVAFCLAVVAFWIYVFATGPEENTASKINDAAFTEAAEVRCATAQAAIELLPPAHTATSPQDRAAVLAEANVLVDDMVRDLRGITPTAEKPRALVVQWLDDYEAYAEARHIHAAALARGEDPQFAVPAEGGLPLTRQMDAFAELNEMTSCEVPQDV